jgi:hypothetical protein
MLTARGPLGGSSVEISRQSDASEGFADFNRRPILVAIADLNRQAKA